MDIEAIQHEVGRRVGRVVEQVYTRPPSNPVFPCAVVEFPTVESFHIDHAHSVSRLSLNVAMFAARGDTDDAIARLAQWVGTDEGNPASVMRAIEQHDGLQVPSGVPWSRIKVVSTSDLRTQGDAVGVTFLVQIDA